MKAAERQRAFALYMNTDWSYRKIAQAIGVSRSSIERWGQEDGWPYKRRRAWSEISKNTVRQTMDDRLKASVLISTELHKILSFAAAEHKNYVEGRIPKKALKFTPWDICRQARACCEVDKSKAQMMTEIELLRRFNFDSSREE